MTEELVTPHFEVLRKLARYTRTPELQHEGRDLLIRFLDAYSTSEVDDPIVDSLCAHFGLFPYMSPDRGHLSTSEALAYEFHRPGVEMGPGREGFVFHSEQSTIFYRLLDGENVILSAPTSFGKSAIVDALVASRKWRNLVVIVPTVALIDEVRRRLVRFSDDYTLITHPGQESTEHNIFVLTQERFLELPELPPVDLFMIDEFYKLGSQELDEQRMSMLNIAWNRLRSTGAQYYLTGPNVDSLAEALDDSLRESLFVSNYKTVAVDVEDRSEVPDEDRLTDMSSYWSSLEESTLVFASSPPRAERVAVEVSEFPYAQAASVLATDVAGWLSDNYHPAWRVVEALRGGVGAHTGPMPRSLQRIMIRLFAGGDVGALVCTTTLIEGVNTTAKNVIIYDKKIDRRPIDYFTFNNVRGRAGRMSSHFLGRVITYMAPPDQQLTEVDIPIDSQPEDAPLSSIVQLPEGELNGASRQRLQDVKSQDDLSLETIKANRGFDPELQIEAARLLRANAVARVNFGWTGYPRNAEVYAVLDFALTNLMTPRQRRSMTINRLWKTLEAVRDSEGDLTALVETQAPYRFPNEDLSDVVANVLAFQRNWMGFTIPSLLRASQRIYNEVATSLGEQRASYEFFLGLVESSFLAPTLLQLDEYGLPLPLALRFSDLGMRGADMPEILASFTGLAQNNSVRELLSPVELWIIDDVLDGLGESLRSNP